MYSYYYRVCFHIFIPEVLLAEIGNTDFDKREDALKYARESLSKKPTTYSRYKVKDNECKVLIYTIKHKEETTFSDDIAVKTEWLSDDGTIFEV